VHYCCFDSSSCLWIGVLLVVSPLHSLVVATIASTVLYRHHYNDSKFSSSNWFQLLDDAIVDAENVHRSSAQFHPNRDRLASRVAASARESHY